MHILGERGPGNHLGTSKGWMGLEKILENIKHFWVGDVMGKLGNILEEGCAVVPSG